MSILDGGVPPVLGDRDPKGPPDNRPPTKPPTQPTYPPPPPPPTKSAGVMNDLQWPDEIPFPEIFPRRKTPKAPKPPKDLRGTCKKDFVAAALHTLSAMARNWRELPALWRETEAYR